MTKELGLEEGPKAEIHTKTTLKKYQIGKRQTMMEYMDSGSRNSSPFTTKNEQIPARSTRTRMDSQWKDHIDPEGPLRGNLPQQLQTLNVPIDNVENINSTNKGRDLLRVNKPQIVP